MGQVPISLVRVKAAPGRPTRGVLVAGALALPVALGRGGIKANKFEGDGATPRGRFRPVRLWFRPDRGPRPGGALPKRRITAADGWCEDPADRHYNRPVTLAPGSTADRLTRADRLYDVIVELDHNMRPRVKKRGSAVFIHLCRPGFSPSAGCITLEPGALRRFVARLTRQTVIEVG
jgi:L,D-peptidoglycan transpeptidase YkuD (ErfK/YbiS/YcfS/YnhG family)